jgi:integrase
VATPSRTYLDSNVSAVPRAPRRGEKVPADDLPAFAPDRPLLEDERAKNEGPLAEVDPSWRDVKIWQFCGLACGLGHLTSHSMRHTYRTWLDDVGTPIGVIQQLMRHADVRTTMNTYGSALPDTMKQAHGSVVEMMLRSAKTGVIV